MTRFAKVLLFLSPALLVSLSPCLSSAQIRVQTPAPKFQPRLEAVAETKLLMEGIHQSNYRGLERLLQNRPADDETWKFARGQALLIAESGNLLMLRPPKTSAGQEPWMRHATDLREKAAALATTTGSRDYERSQAALSELAQSCNRCHQTFRVPTRIGPETRPGVRDAE
jgi:hypothetical protein